MTSTSGPEPTYGGGTTGTPASSLPSSSTPPASDTAAKRAPSPSTTSSTAPTAKPAADRPSTKGEPKAAPARTRGEPNTTGWLSVLVAVALLALQIYYALNATAIDGDGAGGTRSILTFGSLILGLAGAVLALVGMAQRRTPRWPSTVGLSIGVYAFTIAVFSWIGGLMNSANAAG